MQARSYQGELFAEAMKSNVIIKLDTGTGKTFIALMVLKEYIEKYGNKKAFFIVKNASLGVQQFQSIKKFLFLNDEVTIIHGQLQNTNVDMWSKDTWSTLISKYKVIVITAKVFLDIIQHAKFSMDDISLLIFDEVHHLDKEDDYSQIARLLQKKQQVKILGLTACLIKNAKSKDDIPFLIRQLEKRLNCRIITTMDDIVVGSSVRETIITFSEDIKMDSLFQSAIKRLDSEIEILKEKLTSLQMDRNPPHNVKKIIQSLQRMHNNLGGLICRMIIALYLRDIDEVIKIEYDEYIKKTLKFLKTFLNIYMKIDNNNITTEKVERLLSLLKDVVEPDKSTILIFVQERIQALGLDLLLKSKNYKDVKSHFITGHFQQTLPSDLNMTVEMQQKRLRRFRDKQFNVLIATNVIEEGLDIPHCNMVIKFDPVCEFRSYIQAKGRARAENSDFYLFVPLADKFNYSLLLAKFKLFNCVINEELRSRVVDKGVEDEDEEDGGSSYHLFSKYSKYCYEPYGNNGPSINLNTAGDVLNRYVCRLRSNSISEVKISYEFTNNDNGTISGTLQLPMPSPCCEIVSVENIPRKKLAKQLLNYQTCILLHKDYYELNEYLLPHDRYKTIITELDLHTVIEEKEEHLYPVAKILTKEVQNITENCKTFYLYSIEYSSNVFLKLGLENCTMFQDDISLGFLVPVKLSEHIEIFKFPLFLIGGKCWVSVKFCATVSINIELLWIILKCHRALFDLYANRIRKFHQNIVFSPSTSRSQMIVLLLKDNNICERLLTEFLFTQPVSQLIDLPQSKWLGAVIRPTNVSREFGAFVVVNIIKDLNNVCKIKYEKLKKRYQEKMLPSTTLIEVYRVTTVLSGINKEVRNLKDSSRLQRINTTILMLPDVCECISLRAGAWTLLCLFPTVHYRLNQILLLNEFMLKCKVISDHHSQTPDKTITMDPDKCISKQSDNKDWSAFLNYFLPTLLAKSCNDRVDLERHEIFGDSYLKFITSKQLYHNNPRINEGQLSIKRTMMVCNRNLYDVAMGIHLDHYLFVVNFNPVSNYLPPMYGCSSNCDESNGINVRDRSRYKNKNLADCFEAVVGAVLANCNEKVAYDFLKMVNLDRCLKEKYEEDGLGNYDIETPIPQIPVGAEDNTFNVPAWMTELEQTLQYTFRYKYYAVQAITHPTSRSNRAFNCYQRLEFLGDAVLDYLITVYIMLNRPNFSPGTITNLRSAFVCNNTFAYLTVQWRFYKYLNYFDDRMTTMIPEVVEKLENCSLLKMQFIDPQLQDASKVIIKVLGDLFESLAGAVFVDSGYKEEIVWKVFYPLMEEPIKTFMNKVPRNPVAQLHEKYPKLEYNFEVDDYTNLVTMTATLPSEDKTFQTVERNKKLCKIKLAEKLLFLHTTQTT